MASKKQWWNVAAKRIMDDLSDRRGIRQELDNVDDDIKKEILATHAEIIRQAAEEANKS